jgi:hypothetical protein
VFEQLIETGEDPARARFLAEGFERLDERYSPPTDIAAQDRIRGTELRLQKETRRSRPS